MAAIVAGAALSIGGSLIAGGKARSAARAAGRQAAAAQRKIDNILTSQVTPTQCHLINLLC